MTLAITPLSFDLPAHRAAGQPPEARGLKRDEVKLLVADSDVIHHRRFLEMGDALRSGDLLVVNDSRTLPASLPATRSGTRIGLHLSTRLDDGTWVVEMRRPDGAGPLLDGSRGEIVGLPNGSRAELVMPWGSGGTRRLWVARLILSTSVGRYLHRFGSPIRYSYVADRWPLAVYQTVFAQGDREGRGSAEMPSAGRPFSRRLVACLNRRGVAFASITLHTGVSSLEAHEPPPSEWFSVPEATARAIRTARRQGGRVIAVGTTATRALESASAGDRGVVAAAGWTNLVLGPDHPTRVVDGIVSGWHPPEASHLALLEAIAGRDLLESAYSSALSSTYLWHEFGDSLLLLPPIVS